jgi:hypothetical protein
VLARVKGVVGVGSKVGKDFRFETALELVFVLGVGPKVERDSKFVAVFKGFDSGYRPTAVLAREVLGWKLDTAVMPVVLFVIGVGTIHGNNSRSVYEDDDKVPVVLVLLALVGAGQ